MNCQALIRSEHCSTPCTFDNLLSWKQVNKDCDMRDCAVPVDMTSQLLEIRYSSSRSFYGAVEFIGENKNIGLMAWGSAGIYVEGCGRLVRFEKTPPAPIDPNNYDHQEITWTLNISEEVRQIRQISENFHDS